MRKPKLAPNKIVSMKEAIGDTVKPGSEVYLEGFTHLISFAAGHEIIRQGIGDLTAIRLTPDLVYDQLIEAGLVRKLVFSWAGNPGVGSLHALRRRSQKDSASKIELEEYSHFGMVARSLAGSSGLPFWPLKNFEGTHIEESNPKIRSIVCPYTGERFATVPALNPDVAVIHVQRADKEGNSQVWGLMGTQKEIAFASKRVIIVAEEIVDTSVIRRDPNRTLIPGILVDHVVHEPWGCHPSYAQGYYDRDNDFYVKWEEISRDPKTYQDYLNEFVYGVKDRQGYLKKAGSGLIDCLKAKPRKCEGVDYGY
ncbi:CoA transferase subunit A [bacterium]|jgi:glutaconate CoA-transferase subunit A|nr:CoA transferase subunit A [bacterium]